MKIKDVLVVISCLLIEPNPDSALNANAARLFQEDYKVFEARVRTLTGVHARVPEGMRGLVEGVRRRDGGHDQSKEVGTKRRTKEVVLPQRLKTDGSFSGGNMADERGNVPREEAEGSEDEDGDDEEEDGGDGGKENDPRLSPTYLPPNINNNGATASPMPSRTMTGAAPAPPPATMTTTTERMHQTVTTTTTTMRIIPASKPPLKSPRKNILGKRPLETLPTPVVDDGLPPSANLGYHRNASSSSASSAVPTSTGLSAAALATAGRRASTWPSTLYASSPNKKRSASGSQKEESERKIGAVQSTATTANFSSSTVNVKNSLFGSEDSAGGKYNAGIGSGIGIGIGIDLGGSNISSFNTVSTSVSTTASASASASFSTSTSTSSIEAVNTTATLEHNSMASQTQNQNQDASINNVPFNNQLSVDATMEVKTGNEVSVDAMEGTMTGGYNNNTNKQQMGNEGKENRLSGPDAQNEGEEVVVVDGDVGVKKQRLMPPSAESAMEEEVVGGSSSSSDSGMRMDTGAGSTMLTPAMSGLGVATVTATTTGVVAGVGAREAMDAAGTSLLIPTGMGMDMAGAGQLGAGTTTSTAAVKTTTMKKTKPKAKPRLGLRRL